MNQITLTNSTSYIAQFVVSKGDQTLARLPGIQKNESIGVPTDDTYTVIATTQLAGNTYTSAPMQVASGMGFRAKVLQSRLQGTYAFQVEEYASPLPSQLAFQKTCIGPVTFTIQKDGKPLQSIVVGDSFQDKTLDIGDTFLIYAVINGVTTDTLITNNPNVRVEAQDNSTQLEDGYFTLALV